MPAITRRWLREFTRPVKWGYGRTTARLCAGVVMRSATLFLLGILTLLAAPSHAAPPLEAYGQLPAFDMARLSPSGDRIAFAVADGDKRRLFVRKVGGEAIYVTPIGKSKLRAVEWAGEDSVLLTFTGTAKLGNGKVDKWTYSTRYEVPNVLVSTLSPRPSNPF